MPPTTDNPADPAREDGSDADWARWEQTFRDAKPVLPELAMLRIETSMSREIDHVAAAPPARSRLRVRIIWLVLGLIAINVGVVWLLMFSSLMHPHGSTSAGGSGKTTSAGIQDRYQLDVPIGPQLTAPSLPVIPLAEQWNSIRGGLVSSSFLPQSLAPSDAQRDLLRAAEHLCGEHPDGWHAIGLMEMRRAFGIHSSFPAVSGNHAIEYEEVMCWQLLPLAIATRSFPDELNHFLSDLNSASAPARWWGIIFSRCLGRSAADESRIIKEIDPSKMEFPSTMAKRARFDLLVELGVPEPQAGLDILATRSYEPLKSLLVFGSPAMRSKDPILAQKMQVLCSAASHDLVERVVLESITRSDAGVLIQKARNLQYLTDSKALAVLLARLGPQDAWEKLVKPLMENEVAFIQNPPRFDESNQRSLPNATVDAKSKSIQEGVTNYSGDVVLSAGPWRLHCDKLSVYKNTHYGVLLIGTGSIRIRGVIGLYDATAQEFTLNTETGELKLSGHVHLDGWKEQRDVESCTIGRTGEVRP